MTKFLRSIFATIAIALLAGLANQLYADTPKKEKSRIDVIKQGSHEPERDITCYVEAFYDSSLDMIELTCYGLGETYVYIVNSNNQVVYYMVFDSATEPYVVLDAPSSSGTYYLVIEGKNFYGEGVFDVG